MFPAMGRSWCHGSIRLAAALLLAPVFVRAHAETPASIQTGVWTTAAELADLPMAGPAWDLLLHTADEPLDPPDLSDQGNDTDVQVMARALVYARTGIARYRDEVVGACIAAIGTENSGDTLSLARNLLGYVIAADLVGLPQIEGAVFRQWLSQVRHETLHGRTLITTHERRPNNWGTHAGASRLAIAAYLRDLDDLAAAAMVFRGWLGDRGAYAGFHYGPLWWQADPENPVGVNPAGSTIEGCSVDGVLPDDQRRAGPFECPPPQENYVYEALQGAVAAAVILERQGYDAWDWEDRALLRAFAWLHDQAHYPAAGDDAWLPHVVNRHYGTLFPAPVPAGHGENAGWTDWTHASCNADLDGDGIVGAMDLIALLSVWGTECQGPPDFDRDGLVGVSDLLDLLFRWGGC